MAGKPQMTKVIEAGNDVIRASNTLMLMLAGEISLTKGGLETAIRTALDARNAWDNTVKEATTTRAEDGTGER